MNKLVLAILASLGLFLSGCVGTGPNTQQGALVGGSIGALAGAIIGNNSGSHNTASGAAIGAAVGTLAGGTMGNTVDHQNGMIYDSRERAVSSIYTENLPLAPAPVRDVVVGRSPGRGYIWIPGCWAYSRGSYYLEEGRWVRPPMKSHRHYVAPHWERQGYGHVYVRGYWRR